MKKIIYLLFLGIISSFLSSAQTKGFIYKPATTAGALVMDPNSDGYTSATLAGFLTNDRGESEIPYKALPVLMLEPNSDLRTGPGCGFSDFADNGLQESTYTLLDNNNNLMFRFRLGGTAKNSKGYSILIDTDQKFGNSGPNADPTFTASNPGFEIEICLATNFGVRLYNVDAGGSNPSVLVELPYAQYCQKSVAFTTNCSDPDYFYDFYIPFSVITSYFPSINTSTPLRMVANTVIAPQSAIQGPISDIGGFDDTKHGGCYTCAWTALVSNFPPTPATALCPTCPGFQTPAPVVNSPLYNNQKVITGTSTAPNGTVISVYVNGSLYGTTTVTGNAWTFTWTPGGSTPALSTGQTVTAYAKFEDRPISGISNSVVVIGCTSPPVITTVATIPGGGGKDVSGTSSEPAGTVVSIFQNGNAKGSATVQADGTWVQLQWSGSPAATGDIITVSTPNCGTSAPFFYCNGTKTAIPVITSAIITIPTATITGTCVSAAVVTVYKNGSSTAIGTATTTGTGWSFNATGLASCDVITVRAKSGSLCISDASTGRVVSATRAAAPTITGTYCGTTTTVSGTTTAPANSSVQVFSAGTAVGSPSLSSEFGSWSVSGLSIASGTAITAVVTPPTSSCISASVASGSTTAGSQTSNTGLTVTGPITEGNTSVSGTYGTNGASIKVYIDGSLLGTTSVSGTAYTLSGLDAFDLYTGGKVTATATSGGLCESAPSAFVTVQCILPLTNRTVTPTSTQVCSSDSASVTITNSELEVAYQLMNAGVQTGSTKIGTGGSITFKSGPLTSNTTLTIRAYKVEPVACEVDLSTTVSVTVNPLPGIANSVTAAANPVCQNTGTNVIVGTSSVGINYQLRIGTTNVGSAVAGTGGNINLPTNNLIANTTYNVLAINGTTGCRAQLTNTITINVTGPSASQLVTATTSPICTGSSTNINVTTENNAGYTYQIYTSLNATVGSSFVGTGAIISRTTGTLTSTTSYYVTVVAGGCTVRQLTEPTVVVNQNPTTSNAGSNQNVCGSTATLNGNVPSVGTGTWTKTSGSGTITNASLFNTGITGLTVGTSVFRWTIANGACTSSFSDVTLTVNCASVYTVAAARNIDTYANGNSLATVTDADGAITAASITAGTLPAGMAFNTTTGQFTVSNASLLTAGTFNFTVQTTDAQGGITSQPVAITINPDTEAVYTVAAARNVDNYANGNSLATVTDANGAITAASITAGTLPAGMAFNTTTGQFTVSNASLLTAGTFNFTVQTTDATGGITSQPVAITINPDTEGIYYVSSSKRVDLYANNETLATVSDDDGSISRVRILSGTLPAGTKLDSLTGRIYVYDSSLLQDGNYVLDLISIDEEGGYTYHTITLSFQPIPLPVTFISFDAQKAKENIVLTWKTASEINNAKFIIERRNSFGEFENIGEVEGNGTTNAISNYRFIDNNMSNGTRYYRLKQIDFDGKFEYSIVRTITINERTKVVAYPNPTYGNVTINSNSPVTLVVTDITGKQILRKGVFSGITELDLSDYNDGIYFLMLTDDHETQTIKIIKNH